MRTTTNTAPICPSPDCGSRHYPAVNGRGETVHCGETKPALSEEEQEEAAALDDLHSQYPPDVVDFLVGYHGTAYDADQTTEVEEFFVLADWAEELMIQSYDIPEEVSMHVDWDAVAADLKDSPDYEIIYSRMPGAVRATHYIITL